MTISLGGIMSASISTREATSESSDRVSFSYGTLGFGFDARESDDGSLASEERIELLTRFIAEHGLETVLSSELRGRSGFYLALSEIEDERPVLRFGAARGDAISYACVIYFEESVVAKTILLQEFSRDLRERGFEIYTDEESASLVLYDHISISSVMGLANALCERYKPLRSVETMLDSALERQRAHELEMARIRLEQLKYEAELARLREKSPEERAHELELARVILEQLKYETELARLREKSPELRAHELEMARIALEIAKIRERSLEQLRLEAEIARKRI